MSVRNKVLKYWASAGAGVSKLRNIRFVFVRSPMNISFCVFQPAAPAALPAHNWWKTLNCCHFRENLNSIFWLFDPANYFWEHHPQNRANKSIFYFYSMGKKLSHSHRLSLHAPFVMKQCGVQLLFWQAEKTVDWWWFCWVRVGMSHDGGDDWCMAAVMASWLADGGHEAAAAAATMRGRTQLHDRHPPASRRHRGWVNSGM